jgi:hypothetical protein
MRMMAEMGFSPNFHTLIRSLLDKRSVGVRINDVNSDYFEVGRGVRQGDPISPIMFNCVVDVFTRMFIKAASRHLIYGMFRSFCPSGKISMQYDDDTLLFNKTSGVT